MSEAPDTPRGDFGKPRKGANSEYRTAQVHLQVYGVAAPKGSAHAMVSPGGKPYLMAAGSAKNKEQLKAWRHDVIHACRAKELLAPGHPVPIFHPDRALAIAVVYRVQMRKGDLYPDGIRPRAKAEAVAANGRDVDKLNRSTLDAVTQSGRIWIDDSRAAVTQGARVYALPGTWLGAEIMIGYDVLGVVRWFYDRLKAAEAAMADAKAAGLVRPPSAQTGLPL